MPDGGAPGEYRHVRQAGAFRPLPRGVDADAWRVANRRELDAPPVEEVEETYTICFDAAPIRDPDFRPRPGVGIEHTVSQYTLEACGIFRPGTTMPQVNPDDVAALSLRDPVKRARTKEQRRAKRNRSRITRDGNAPQLDPLAYPAEHSWAVERVNWIARRRFSPPEGRVTMWAHLVTPFDLEVFHGIARHGGGHGSKKKHGPDHFVHFFLTKHPELRDAPTPLYEGHGALAALAEQHKHLTAEPETPTPRDNHEPTYHPQDNAAAHDPSNARPASAPQD